MSQEIAWPAVAYETLPWERDADQIAFIPKARRRKILSTYEAAVPPSIAALSLKLPSDLACRLADLGRSLARFDAMQRGRGYRLPALLLRSESAASSQIENLTSSVRNVALAEVAPAAPRNAQLIAGNVSAMRQALAQQGALDIESIRAVHRCLLRDASYAGSFRDEQVWIGGTPYSPHGASFVPPCANRLRACLDDLVSFAERDDIDPLAGAAIFHAQFETIHPFIDGNGRTGRALVHHQLASRGVMQESALPLSAGLLHDIDAYLAALDAYHDGEIAPTICVFADALETALVLGAAASKRIEIILESWNELIVEREGSAIRKLPGLLVEQPVITTAYVSERFQISSRAALSLLSRACEYGILEHSGNYRRGKFYQAADLLEVLEDTASKDALRRMS